MIGFAQAKALQPYTTRWKWWIAANLVSWLIVDAVFYLVSLVIGAFDFAHGEGSPLEAYLLLIAATPSAGGDCCGSPRHAPRCRRPSRAVPPRRPPRPLIRTEQLPRPRAVALAGGHCLFLVRWPAGMADWVGALVDLCRVLGQDVGDRRDDL